MLRIELGKENRGLLVLDEVGLGLGLHNLWTLMMAFSHSRAKMCCARWQAEECDAVDTCRWSTWDNGWCEVSYFETLLEFDGMHLIIV